MPPGKKSTRKKDPEKIAPQKISPGNIPQEKCAPENCPPEECSPKKLSHPRQQSSPPTHPTPPKKRFNKIFVAFDIILPLFLFFYNFLW